MKSVLLATVFFSAISFASENVQLVENKNTQSSTKGEFQNLGIKKGDIVTTIDDEPIDTPEKAMKLFEKMKDHQSVRVQRKQDPEHEQGIESETE